MFNCFLAPGIAGTPFSKYWARQFYQGVPSIVLPVLASTVSGLLAARSLRALGSTAGVETAWWFTAGAVLAAGHLAFVPAVGPLINAMIENGRKGNGLSAGQREKRNGQSQRTWFMWHTLRSLSVDALALMCFAKGVVMAVEVA